MPIPTEAPPLPKIDPDEISGTYAMMCLLREFADSIKDEGTGIDSGFGFGEADFQVTRRGVEYNIQISANTPLTAEEIAEGEAFFAEQMARVGA